MKILKKEKCQEQKKNGQDIHRQLYWSEKIALGNKNFVEKFKEDMGIKSKYKEIIQEENISYIKEDEVKFNNNNMKDSLFYWNLDSFYT